MPNSLETYISECNVVVEKQLDKYLPRRTDDPKTLHEAMRYSIFAGGKRIRPVLCCLAGELCGAKREECLAPACAIEMIHTYSLIHDDLPSMDNDDYRRGKLSCHKAFGEAMAILAGDALLTHAFDTIARYAAPDCAAELVKVLAHAAGPAGMVGGQVLDLEAEGADPELARVENIHRLKTGALLTAAVELGAVAGRAKESDRAALVQYGRKLGLAFQIKDDILDITAPKDKLGKTSGKDAATGKMTYPAVLGLGAAQMLLLDTVVEAKDALSPFGDRSTLFLDLADYIANRDK